MVTTYVTIWRENVALRSSPSQSGTQQVIYGPVAWYLLTQSVLAVHICFFHINAAYNEPLEAAHCYGDNA